MEFELIAQNIKCSGCANSIQNGLSKLDGVEEVAVNVETGAVTVKGTASKEKISEELSKLGYPEKK